MNIYDVAELQQYLNPQVNQQSTQLVDPTMLFRQRSPLLGIQSQRLSDPEMTLIPQIPGGITASSAAIPFGSPVDIAQGFVKGSPSDTSFSPPRIDTSFGVANEEDVEQVDYLGSKPTKVQTGIAKLFEFLQRFSPVANIARGLQGLRNRFDTRKAIQRDIQRDTQGGPITTFRNVKQQQQDKIDDRGRGQIPTRTARTTTPRRSSSYSAANRAFARSR